MMKLDSWIAHRMLVSKKRVGFVSWSGLISILGVTVGSFALVISVAILNGFEQEVRKKIVGFESDVRALGDFNKDSMNRVESILQKIDGIKSYSFFLERKGLIITGQDRRLVQFKSVQNHAMADVYQLSSDAEIASSTERPIIHIGYGLAEQIGVQVGDKVKLLSPLDSKIYSGLPSIINAEVGHIFTTNILDFDDKYCFIPLSIGQALFNKPGNAHGVDIRIGEGYDKEAVIADLKLLLPKELNVLSWRELHSTLFSAMRMEKIGSIFVLSLIIVVASFNIASTMVMLVLEKVREIGILKTLGASRKRIQRIFGFQGIIIGSIGLISGLSLGLLLILLQKQWGLISLPENIYFIKSLPASISAGDVMIITIVAAMLIFIAIYYPAKIAGKLTPKEAVRFEK